MTKSGIYPVDYITCPNTSATVVLRINFPNLAADRYLTPLCLSLVISGVEWRSAARLATPVVRGSLSWWVTWVQYYLEGEDWTNQLIRVGDDVTLGCLIARSRSGHKYNPSPLKERAELFSIFYINICDRVSQGGKERALSVGWLFCKIEKPNSKNQILISHKTFTARLLIGLYSWLMIGGVY